MGPRRWVVELLLPEYPKACTVLCPFTALKLVLLPYSLPNDLTSKTISGIALGGKWQFF